MGMSGTRRVGPLECPECGAKILWDGTQHVCLACPWKEHVARPPSERKIPLPKKKPDEEE
jgi:hypothetical protein